MPRRASDSAMTWRSRSRWRRRTWLPRGHERGRKSPPSSRPPSTPRASTRSSASRSPHRRRRGRGWPFCVDWWPGASVHSPGHLRRARGYQGRYRLGLLRGLLAALPQLFHGESGLPGGQRQLAHDRHPWCARSSSSQTVTPPRSSWPTSTDKLTQAGFVVVGPSWPSGPASGSSPSAT
jgi:hypothetical protein